MKTRINPAKRPSRLRTDLQSDSKTLRYELENLIGMARDYDLSWIKTDPIRNNAYVEAFAVHCRALIYFLYGHLNEIAANGKSAKFSGKEPRDSDVLAYDFHQSWDRDCPPPTDVMIECKRQADKHVAHITTERREVNQPGSSKESVWKLGDAASAIATIMRRFLEQAPPDNFDTAELRRMRELLSEWSNASASSELPSVPPLARHPLNPSASWLQGRTDSRTLSPEPGFNIHGKTG
jgi:hypothetical protein